MGGLDQDSIHGADLRRAGSVPRGFWVDPGAEFERMIGSVSFSLFVRQATKRVAELDEVLRATSALPEFSARGFGFDERKRSPFDASAFRERATTGTESRVFLWYDGTGDEPSQWGLSSAIPNVLSFTLGKKAVADAERYFGAYESLLEALRPEFASVRFTFSASDYADAKELVAENQRNRAPTTINEIYLAGLGGLQPHTYLHAGFATLLGEPTLLELGAVRLRSGDWRICPHARPWLLSASEQLAHTLETKNVLRRHGLLGRSEHPVTGPFFFGPNWRRPSNWTNVLERRERKVAGPNV